MTVPGKFVLGAYFVAAGPCGVRKTVPSSPF